MKIKSIEIKNYKAFYGTHKINIGGRNAFIYGENGSGKSSLYYALKDFVQSSMEDFQILELENIFVPTAKKGQPHIKVKIQLDSASRKRVKEYELSPTINTGRDATDPVIRDCYQLKSFLTYKHLLEIHYVKKGEEINLFNLLVNGVLKHFKYALTNGKELGEMWQELNVLAARETSPAYNVTRKKRDVQKAADEFNRAFGQLFILPTPSEPNPEYLLDHAQPILAEFGHNLEINLRFRGVEVVGDKIINDKVSIALHYAGRDIPSPHLFLNEARLSAIAISIYLGMIKRHPQIKKFKILFLDDIFIGLDISNRLPLLTILNTHFADYQIFITTYDKPWYEFVKSMLGSQWTTIEFYAQLVNEGYEIPMVVDRTDFLVKARQHYNKSDYKASAVYARSAFEKVMMDYCVRKGKKLAYKSRRKDYKAKSFWEASKSDLQPATVTKIERFTFLIYNPLSHYDPDSNPIKSELLSAVEEVENLRVELSMLP